MLQSTIGTPPPARYSPRHGPQAFAERMLNTFQPGTAKTKSRAYSRTAERPAHGWQQAERWLQEGLSVAGLAEADLTGLKGTDARKVVLADLLWRHTTVPQSWLAEKLDRKSVV